MTMHSFYNAHPQEINVWENDEVTLPNKKYKVLSLFSGCGGMDLGFLGGFEYLNKHYSQNPFEINFSNDIFTAAIKVYEHNLKHKPVEKSIMELDISTLPQADVVVGGFPCQDFSLAGKRKGLSSERGRLYEYMMKVVEHSNPKVFVAENVDGIRMNKRQKNESEKASLDTSALDIILQDFEEIGYRVQYKVLHAADFGIPQTRKRVIIIGVRNDVLSPVFYPAPTHDQNYKESKLLPWVTSSEAIDDLWDKIDSPDVLNHTSKDYSRAKFYPGKKMQGNMRISGDKPSCTIRAEHHGNIEAHYRTLLADQNDMSGWRRLSVRECARIQSFPDDFHFNVSASSAYKMIGNAVPPVLGWHIAKAVLHILNTDEKNIQEASAQLSWINS